MTGALFYASVVGAVAAVVRATRRHGAPVPIFTLVWLAGLAFLGAYAERGVAWWAFGAPVALAPTVAALSRRPAAAPRDDPRAPARPQRRGRRVLAIAVVALQPALAGGRPAHRPGRAFCATRRPGLARAAAPIVAGPSDRAVVPQPWASWFEWAAPGRPRDGRLARGGRARLGLGRLRDDRRRRAGRPGDARGVGASVVVVDPATQAALELALRTPGSGWRLAYEDADGAVFTRQP